MRINNFWLLLSSNGFVFIISVDDIIMEKALDQVIFTIFGMVDHALLRMVRIFAYKFLNNSICCIKNIKDIFSTLVLIYYDDPWFWLEQDPRGRVGLKRVRFLTKDDISASGTHCQFNVETDKATLQAYTSTKKPQACHACAILKRSHNVSIQLL